MLNSIFESEPCVTNNKSFICDTYTYMSHRTVNVSYKIYAIPCGKWRYTILFQLKLSSFQETFISFSPTSGPSFSFRQRQLWEFCKIPSQPSAEAHLNQVGADRSSVKTKPFSSSSSLETRPPPPSAQIRSQRGVRPQKTSTHEDNPIVKTIPVTKSLLRPPKL